MAKRQGGIIGRANPLTTSHPSGVWDKSELAIANAQSGTNPGPKAPQLEVNYGSTVPTPDNDPFIGQTVCHVTTDDIDWFTKDRSGKNWHWMQQRDQHYRVQQVVRTGPKYPYWSIHFPHEDSDSEMRYAANAGHSLGSGTFTIDFWVKKTFTGATERYIMGRGGQAAKGSGQGWVVGIDTSANLFFYDAVANVTHTTSGVTITTDTWHFISICRAGTGSNQFTISVDGTVRRTGTCASNFNDDNALRIGCDRVGTTATNCASVLADIRITSNSSATAVPTGPMDMTGAKFSHSITTRHWDSARTPSNTSTQPQGYDVIINQLLYKTISNPWEDDSSHAGYKWTFLTGKGSSSIFSHTEDKYLIHDKNTSDTSLRFGTSPFTIEAWVYIRNNGSLNYVCGKGVHDTSGWAAGLSPAYMYWDSGSTRVNSPHSYGDDAKGCWHHVAWVREGTGSNQFYMYFNGVRIYQGTDSSNYTGTENLYILGGRNSTGGWYGMCSGLRISNTAKYTASSFTPDIDTSLTADASTLYLIHSPTGKQVSNSPQWEDLGFGRKNFRNGTNEGPYLGNKGPYGRWGSGISNNSNTGYDGICIYSPTSGYWTLGTSDFSLEFWHLIYDRQNYRAKCLVDFRPTLNWNANALSIYCHLDAQGDGSIFVMRNGQVFLSGPGGQYQPNEWRHVCLTRISHTFRLYINGKVVAERYDTSSISESSSKINLLNGNHNVDHDRYGYGAIKDFRLDKNTSAYPAGDSIPLPVSELQPTANTLVLTANGLGMYDTTWKYNDTVQVWNNYFDNRGFSRPGYGWNVHPTAISPYPLRPKVEGYTPATDVLLDTGSHYSTNTLWYMYDFTDSGIESDACWYTRLAKPFTLEFFYYAMESDVSSVGGDSLMYTADSNGQRGFHIYHNHVNGSTTNGYGRVNLRWFSSAGITDYNTLNSPPVVTGFDYRSAKGHAWNHFALSYDPSQGTASNRWAIFLNGYRHVLTSPPTANNFPRTTYPLTANSTNMAGIRISTNVRYNHLQSTYTVPKFFTPDANTFLLNVQDETVWTDNKRSSLVYCYGPMLTDNCKMPGFGNNILMISNESVVNLCNSIQIGGSYEWQDRAHWFFKGDWTIESWAAWQPASQGGKAFGTYQYLFDMWNELKAGLNSSGQWMFWFANANSDGTLTTYSNMTISTGIAAKLTTSNSMDHVVMMRQSGNVYCFLNGVLAGTLINADFGTSSYGANSNSPQANYDSDWYGNTYVNHTRWGCDWHSRKDRTWTGVVNEFRLTKAARYDVAVINNVNTMVHRGTKIPALPTTRFPRNELRAT